MRNIPPAAPAPAPGAHPVQADRLLHDLEWKVIRRLNGLLQGDYRTLLRGGGLDLYLERELGLSAAERSALRDAFTE